MKVQNLPLDDIKPYWRNPRKNKGAIAIGSWTLAIITVAYFIKACHV